MEKFYIAYRRLLSLQLLLSLAFQLNAEPVTPDEAIVRANTFFDEISSRHMRSQSQPQLFGSASPAMAQPQLAYTSSYEGTDTYYAFNNTDGKGFLILSADTQAPAVLAYSDEGSFNLSSMPDGLQYLLSTYDAAISYATKNDITLGSSFTSSTPRAAIEPLLTTRWGQVEPYNGLAPTVGGAHCVTGCVATALAQLIYYHKPSASFTGSSPWTCYGGDVTSGRVYFSDYSIDYSSMQNYYGATILPGDETATNVEYSKEAAEAIAKLMLISGAAARTQYGLSASLSAGTYYVTAALKNNFHFSKDLQAVSRGSYTDEEWEDLIYSQLAAGLPLYYEGVTKNNEGHAFVCDGYDGNGLYHINWGWKGLADGYYAILGDDQLHPTHQGTGGSLTNDGFSFSQAIIRDMKLEASTLPSESILQIAPETIVTATQGTIALLSKSPDNIQCAQLSLQLPQGVSISSIAKGPKMTSHHIADYNQTSTADNTYTILVWSDDEGAMLNADNDTLLYLNCTYDASIAEGNHAVYSDGNVIGASATHGDYPSLSSSLLVNGTMTTDFSSLKGYVPNHVADFINEKLASRRDYTAILLQNADSINTVVKATNANALIYVKKDSPAETFYTENVYDNVVSYSDATGLYSAKSIVLHASTDDFLDDAANFNATSDISAETMHLHRTFGTKKKSTICLPYSLSAEGVSRYDNSCGITFYTITRYNADTRKIYFEKAAELAANTPYMVYFSEDAMQQTFDDLTSATLCSTSTINDVTVDDITMHGTYTKHILESDQNTSYYGYDEKDGTFRKVGKNVTLYPFRAYMSLPASTSNPASLQCLFDVADNDEATGISEVSGSGNESHSTYNIAGQRVSPAAKGIIITNKAKYYVK